jgi:multidrug resistance efflux pump
VAVTEERVRQGPRASEGGGRSANGHARTADVEDAPAQPRRYALRFAIFPALIAAVLLAVTLGVLYFTEQTGYVSTDNATVTGTVIQVGPPVAGQVRSVLVEVGESVDRNQVVATVNGSGGQTISLRAGMDGVVLGRFANPGDTLTAGRPIISVLDPAELWIQAQVDETLVSRIEPGQPVDVSVDAAGETLPGTVIMVGRASVAALNGTNVGTGSSALRARQLVPVKIGLDRASPRLVYGGQAFIRIHV